MAADWSDLPNDLLVSISKRTEHLSDYIRLGAVCKSWRSAITVNPRPLHLRFPLLFLSQTGEEGRDHRPLHLGFPLPFLGHPLRALYSPFERKLHPFKLPDRPRPQRCIGSSSDGWICMVDDFLDIYLYNPFSGSVVLLPSLKPFFIFPPQRCCVEYMYKVVWSAEPTDPNCILALVWNKSYSVLYCRPGNAVWTDIHISLKCVSDAIFYKERLYMVGNSKGRVVAIDLLHQGHEMMMPKVESFPPYQGKHFYLAAGPSGLLFIVRHLKDIMHIDIPFMAKGFELFIFDEMTKKWVRTNSLDEGMLFLGLNTSMWLSSTNFKECKGNSIYFTDDKRTDREYDVGHHHVGEDTGVFLLEEKSFSSIYIDDVKLTYPNYPVWVVPNL